MSAIKEWILGGLCIWFAVGFAWGAAETVIMRNRFHYDYELKKQIEDSKSGCVYSSVSSFLNLGHVAACELFRHRWDLEGFK